MVNAFYAAIGPSLAIVALTCVLGWYSWRRRSQPGALPFAVACLFAFLWALGSLLEIISEDPVAKAQWYAFKAMWLLGMVCAITSFVLQYAGLGRWLTRRMVRWAFVVPSVVIGLLLLTNGYHGLGWPRWDIEGSTIHPPGQGLVGTVALWYFFLLALFNLVVLVRLFMVSPRHRWPVGLMVLGQVVARVAFTYEVFGHSTFITPDPEVVAVGIPFSLYAVALFGFHVFDPIPEARAAAVGQMRDAMVVLDLKGKVVYANPAAEAILGEGLPALQGHRLNAVLPGLARVVAEPSWVGAESFRQRQDDVDRDYSIGVTKLTDSLGQPLGRLLLVRDVTDEHRAQAYQLDEQRASAALRERERLARELHDSIGQVLGYLSLQAQAAQKWLRKNDVARASVLLDRLTEVAQEAHADVREAIAELHGATPAASSFVPALAEYAADFERQHHLPTVVSWPGDLPGDLFSAGTGVQVLRVIQEAMSNARNHGQARSLRITINAEDGMARITVADDGHGFDPATVAGRARGQFGLTFMRERMGDIGGSLELVRRPEGGTAVVLRAPLRPRMEGAA
ncbi:MAG: histidine kinase N-terminal 7TM domain-containing protein [Propionicimonas sp.]